MIFVHSYLEKLYNKINIFNKKSKEEIVVLGDGFFARGFLHHINQNRFNITQIYLDDFINPQDLFYNLQRNKKYSKELHFRDYLNIFNNPITKINTEIKTLNIHRNRVDINEFTYNYDYLIVGLGSAKTLKSWSIDINNLIDIRNKNIGIIGLGPVGLELGFILNSHNKISMFDMLSKDKILSYVKPLTKEFILREFTNKNIDICLQKPFDKNNYNFDSVIFCVGNRPNSLTCTMKINKHLQLISNNNIFENVYVGGDCVNSEYIKNAQVAYQQGKYVAQKINGQLRPETEFKFKSEGISLNLGNKQVLIEDNPIIPNGIYPDIVIKLYSLFAI